MAYYQFKLTPVEYFFFGGEKHDAELKTNYFVESNPYPQQTTILGLLRYYLLLKNADIFQQNKILNSTKAGNLIGFESFSYPGNQNFGKIKSISPLYFFNKNEKYFFAPIDTGFVLANDFTLFKDGSTYNAKYHSKSIHQKLYSLLGKEEKALHDVVCDIQQTGNEKGDSGESKDEAYYKQVMKRFVNSDWSFGFDANVDGDSNIEEETLFIPFGGEKCFFEMNIKNVKYLSYPEYPHRIHKREHFSLLCISDCFVNTQLMEQANFALNTFTSFRNLLSKTSTKNFDALKKETDKINQGQIRSKRYNLLQRGSVLYFTQKDKMENFAKSIKNSSVESIGFNHILVNK